MWIGRRPAALPTMEHLAESEEFADAVTTACAEAGCSVQDYVAAAGAWGSWLIRFSRTGVRQRLVWNGKEGRLLLEQATAGIDWDELECCAVTERDTASFIAAVRGLLRRAG
jgi:hypothetical protein